MPVTRLVMVEVKVVENGKHALESGADLCAKEGQKLSEYRVSLAERKEKKERKKEKRRFLTVCGSVGRRPFWTVGLCLLVVFHT